MTPTRKHYEMAILHQRIGGSTFRVLVPTADRAAHGGPVAGEGGAAGGGAGAPGTRWIPRAQRAPVRLGLRRQAPPARRLPPPGERCRGEVRPRQGQGRR